MATILIVDDEEPVRELLAAIFELAGVRALKANNGRRALELFNQDRPDLVLSDVMMPVMSGANLCRLLKAEPSTATIPIILMSAAGQQVTDGTGADAYLDKPFELDQLEALVFQWLPADADQELPSPPPTGSA